MVKLFTRMAIVVIVIVVIAEGVEYWRGLAFPESQWWIVPLIMVLTILAILLNLWILLKKYKIDQ